MLCVYAMFVLNLTLVGINSYEDLGEKALKKPGKVSVVFWILPHQKKREQSRSN